MKYCIVWKTTPRCMRFCKIKNRLIHVVLEYLWRYNATSMAIFSPYIRGRVVIQVVLFSRLYGISDSRVLSPSNFPAILFSCIYYAMHAMLAVLTTYAFWFQNFTNSNSVYLFTKNKECFISKFLLNLRKTIKIEAILKILLLYLTKIDKIE